MLAVERGTTPLELRRFTVEWTAVNKYTQADGTVRNLTDSYTFTVTPLDRGQKALQHYGDDLRQGRDGRRRQFTHKRGEIKTVTKTTYNGKTTELEQTNDVDEETTRPASGTT